MGPFSFPLPDDHGRRRSDPPLMSDEQLAMQVVRRLSAEILSADHRIVVEVQNRVVILEGIVASATVRRLAHRVVWETSGVFDVSNRLTLPSPG